jgi:hypothetical protein
LANNNFQIQLWDQQAEITINLMWALQANPTISTYEAVFGPYDHNQHMESEDGIWDWPWSIADATDAM